MAYALSSSNFPRVHSGRPYFLCCQQHVLWRINKQMLIALVVRIYERAASFYQNVCLFGNNCITLLAKIVNNEVYEYYSLSCK